MKLHWHCTASVFDHFIFELTLTLVLNPWCHLPKYNLFNFYYTTYNTVIQDFFIHTMRQVWTETSFYSQILLNEVTCRLLVPVHAISNWPHISITHLYFILSQPIKSCHITIYISLTNFNVPHHTYHITILSNHRLPHHT